MKQGLQRILPAGCYHVVDGTRVAGVHDALSGDVSALSGDVDDCGLTDAERATGVAIAALVEAGE